MFSNLRDCLAMFFSLEGCLANFGVVGILPCFDLTHWPDFGIGFRLGNRGNLDSGSS